MTPLLHRLRHLRVIHHQGVDDALPPAAAAHRLDVRRVAKDVEVRLRAVLHELAL